jgi:hypothetical protein
MRPHRSIWRKPADFWADRRGGTTMLFALAMPVLIGSLGLGFEVSNWYRIQRDMQNVADAAVLAASSNGGANFDIEGKAVAAQLGFSNGVNGAGVTVLRNVACPGGGTTCYSATITNSVPLYLSPVVGYAGNGGGTKSLSVTALATQGTIQRPYCVLALASSGNAISSNGAPNANLSGCSVKSNASARCNGHDLGADYGDTVGTNNGCGKVQNTGVPATADPYAARASNIPANPCAGSYPQEPSGSVTTWSGTRNLSGNVIVCGDLKLTGNVTINAPSNAVLIIENGRLNTNGFTLQTASGSGLTVVFSGTTAGSYSHVPTGSGTLDIAAPTTGPWAGVAIYQDPILTSGVNISSAGNSPTWKLTGLVYLPRASVGISGAVNKSTNGLSCFALVVDNLTVSGTASILSQGQCAAAGLAMPTGTAPGRGRLVY